MNDCPTCGFPMVWSEDNRREWCSVYGDHPVFMPGRKLVTMCLEAPNNSRVALRHRARKHAHRYPHVATGDTQGDSRNSQGCASSAPQAVERTIVA